MSAALHNAGMGKKSKKRNRPTFIKEWRKHRDLSQVQLSERVGITQGALSDLENGRYGYTQPVLEALADALNCSPADLIMRPPNTSDELRDILTGLDEEGRKRALAIVKALKASEAA